MLQKGQPDQRKLAKELVSASLFAPVLKVYFRPCFEHASLIFRVLSKPHTTNLVSVPPFRRDGDMAFRIAILE